MDASLSILSILVLGFGLGIKHAVEADHVAAVSTIVAEHKSTMRAVLVGTLWGLGHSASLVVMGLVVILLQVEIGARLALGLEFGVAIMLIVLGANVLRKLVRGGYIHMHPHRHGRFEHAHPHVHAPEGAEVGHGHAHGAEVLGGDGRRAAVKGAARPVVVGMIHGLAGSSALMLLVLSTIADPVVALAYVAVFGIGSTGGMALMSALMSLPFRLSAARYANADRAMQCLAGLFSLGFGLWLAWEIGIVEGLFVR